MSVVDKAVRVAYEWYKRNFGPPQPPTAQAVPTEPPAPPRGWIAWDEPEAPPISPLAAEMIAGLEGKHTIREIHKDGRPTGGDDD